MVEKVIMSPRNVVDLARYQAGRAAGSMAAISLRICRHCGAMLLEGEREEECSGAVNVGASGVGGAPRKFYAE
jgi:hypothetical protein